MNIIFIVHKSEIGGATLSVQTLILKLIKNYNCNITVVTPIKGKFYDFCKDNNINVIISGHDPYIITDGNSPIKKMIRKSIVPLLKIRHYFIQKKSMSIIESKINLSKINLIHTNIMRDDIGYYIAKKYNIKHIVHLREFGSNDYNWISYFKNPYKYIDKYTTKYIAISDCVKNYFLNKGLDENKIVRIYNGIDIKKYTFNNRKENKKFKILFAGGISKNKGQYQLINALNYFDNEMLKNIEIDFYGSGNKKYIEYLKSIIPRKANNMNIHFNKYIDNFNKVIGNYDVGIVASKSEAFGRVTVEYMASGVIPIVSDKGANPELICDEKDGFIYKYNNFESLANIIYKVYKLSSDERKKIINNGIKKVNNCYTADLNAKKIYKLYEKTLKEM